MSTTIRPATPMRPIAGLEDEPRALELFCVAIYDDPEAFAELVPAKCTPKPVAIAEDGSAAEIELYSYDLRLGPRERLRYAESWFARMIPSSGSRALAKAMNASMLETARICRPHERGAV